MSSSSIPTVLTDEEEENLEDFERIAEEAKKALTLLLNVNKKRLTYKMMRKERRTSCKRGNDWGKPRQPNSFWSNNHTTTVGVDRTVCGDEATVDRLDKCGANGTVERAEEDVDKARQLRQH
uniref:Uncharacterized protein n=1 Tax=Globodera pallida TaxID=36090 RepID=A0A183BQC0_GLOPA